MVQSPTHTSSITSTNSADSIDNVHTTPVAGNPSPLGIITSSSPEEKSPIGYEMGSPISNPPVIPPKDDLPLSPSLASPIMCAIFEYQPQNDDEVALSINDKVEIVERKLNIYKIIIYIDVNINNNININYIINNN